MNIHVYFLTPISLAVLTSQLQNPAHTTHSRKDKKHHASTVFAQLYFRVLDNTNCLHSNGTEATRDIILGACLD